MANKINILSTKPLNGDIENASDKRSEAPTLMKMEKPMNMKREGFISPKGPGPKLDQYTRPARKSKILY